MALADLLVRIGVDTAAFTSGLERFNQNVARSAREAEKQFSGLTRIGNQLQGLGTSLAASVSLPLGALGAASLKAFGDIDALKRGLATLEGTAERTEKRFRVLQEVAKLPGLGLEEAVRGDIRLRNFGFTAEKSAEILFRFGNAVAAAGGSKSDLEETTRQLGQLAARGKVTADNLKPIIERVPQVAAIIKKNFGTIDSEGLTKLGVDAKTLIETILKDLGLIPPVTSGIKNALENFGDDTKKAFAAVGEAISPTAEKVLASLSVIVNKVPDLAKAFTDLPEPAKLAAIGIASVAFVGPLAIVSLGTILSAISSIGAAIATLAKATAVVSAVQAVGAAIAFVASTAGQTAILMGALQATLVAAPWLALAAAVGKLTFELYEYAKAKRLIRDLEQQQRDSQGALIISLRQAGVDVDALAKQKRQGIITEKEYAEAIRQAALALGDQRRIAAQAAESNGTVAKTAATAKSALADLAKRFAEGSVTAQKYLTEAARITGVQTSAQASALKLKEQISALSQELATGQITQEQFAIKLQDLRKGFNQLAQGTAAQRRELEKYSSAAQRVLIIESERAESIRKTADIIRQFERGLNPRLETSQLKEQLNQLKSGILGFTVPIELVPVVRELESPNADLQRALSVVSNRDAVKRNIDNIKAMGKAYQASGAVGARAMREVSTIITNLSQGIGQAIFSGEKFGAVMVRIAKQIGASLVSFVIQELIRATGLLEGFSRLLSGVIKNIAGGAASQVAGSVGGAAAGAAGTVAAGAGSAAAGAGASAAGGAASAASGLSGALGIFSAVTGAVTAISSVFSNFQMATLNKNVKLVEEQARFIASDLANLRADEFVRKDEMFRKLDDLFNFTWVKLDELIVATRSIGTLSPAGAGGGPQIVNNFALSAFVAPGGESQFIDWLAVELRRRGIVTR